MLINDDFEAIEVTVFRLVRNGRTIIDEHGRPCDYTTLKEATEVARNWHLHRMPTYEQLQAMSDDDILERIHRLEKPS